VEAELAEGRRHGAGDFSVGVLVRGSRSSEEELVADDAARAFVDGATADPGAEPRHVRPGTPAEEAWAERIVAAIGDPEGWDGVGGNRHTLRFTEDRTAIVVVSTLAGHEAVRGVKGLSEMAAR
jgi:hypothetical protein